MWTRSLLRASSSSNRRGQRNGGLLRIFCGNSRRTICLLLGTDNGKLLWCQFASKCHRYHRAIFPADVFFAPVVAWVGEIRWKNFGVCFFHDVPVPVIVFCCVSEDLLFFSHFLNQTYPQTIDPCLRVDWRMPQVGSSYGSTQLDSWRISRDALHGMV